MLGGRGRWYGGSSPDQRGQWYGGSSPNVVSGTGGRRQVSRWSVVPGVAWVILGVQWLPAQASLGNLYFRSKKALAFQRALEGQN